METAFSSNREACYHPGVIDGCDERTRAWHVGRSRPRAAGPSTIRARHRADLLRGLDLAGVLRARARGHLQAGLAERRPGGAAAAQRAATSPRSWPSPRPRWSSCAARDGEIRAFHNICRHRGNKLVWNDFPREETSGGLPPVHLQVPRLALRPRRLAHLRPAGGGVLRPRQGRLRAGPGALRRVGRLHLRQPGQASPSRSLREFLGPMVTELEGYPFDKLTERFFYRAAVERQLEALHGRLPGVLPRTRPARPADAARLRRSPRSRPASRRRYYQIDGPAPPGEHGRRPSAWDAGRRHAQADGAHHAQRAVRPLGHARPRVRQDAGRASTRPGATRGASTRSRSSRTSSSSIWGQGWYLTYHYWPTSSRHATSSRATLYFVPAKTARERRGARDGGGDLQGVRAPGRQHARGDPDDARVARCSSGSRSTTRRSSAGTCTRWPPTGSTTTRSAKSAEV